MRRPGYLGDLSDTWFGDFGDFGRSKKLRKKMRRRVAKADSLWCPTPEAQAGKCCVGGKPIGYGARGDHVAYQHKMDCSHARASWQRAQWRMKTQAAAKAKAARKAHPGPPPPGSSRKPGFQKNQGR